MLSGNFPSLSMKQDSWLYSDSFLKRAFAVWGHNAVASLIIGIPFMILWSVVMAVFLVPLIQHSVPSQQPVPGMMRQQGLPAGQY
jgi:hypothetical protein